MPHYDANSLWNSINQLDCFKNFKENGANHRIVQYNYNTHSLLFFKNILFQMANSLGIENLKLLEKIPNRHVGGGINTSYKKIKFDLDYLLALDELLFLKNILQKSDSILEIGAGYGRTCHSILSLFETI